MAYRDMAFDRKTAKVARYFDRVRDGKMGVPISLQVALCDACFNRCIMCDHPKREPHKWKVEEWLAWLEIFAYRGVESVCYSGGDPMAYPEFNEVMEHHIRLKVEFGMTITGYVPPRIDLQLLKHARWVRCSLDAVTPEVYEKVRGKTSVYKVQAGILRMVEAGVPVGLGITVHADNEADLPNVLEWAKARGITDIETHHIEPDSGPRATKAIQWARKIEPFQHCHAVYYQLYIDAQADVYPCCITAGDAHAAPQAYPVGNLHRDDWGEKIWPEVRRYAKLSYQELPPICRSCCIQRLSQTNMIVDQLEAQNQKEFF
jgi:radical SAM protein with 4Fe4S-binding SPASM domain